MRSLKRFMKAFLSVALLAGGWLTLPAPGKSTLPTASADAAWDVKSDTWVGTDSLGRSMPVGQQTRAPQSDKFVGMFYFLWEQEMGEGGYGPFDNSQIVANNAGAMSNSSSPPWGNYYNYHYWGQPMYGYYMNEDDYILKKHAQMLSDAGVDTVIFDLSNYSNGNNYYKDTFLHLMSVWSSIRASGGRTPQVMFQAPFWGGGALAEKLYADLYSQNLYPELWFKWEGKPLILADPGSVSNPAVSSFFTFRNPQPGYGGPSGSMQWGWLSNSPQAPYYTSTNAAEEMPVGVSQNASIASGGLEAMSTRDGSGNYIARGRSYHNGTNYMSTNPLDPNYPSRYGYNFAEQWSRALDVDPNFVYVTSWNEWIAMRFPSWQSDTGPNTFPDQFLPEFSRDIEPMNGGFGDAYYNQLVQFVRQYKGANDVPTPSAQTTISLDGSFSDWTNVGPEYRDDIGDPSSRNNAGFNNYTTFVDNTGRNDIKIAKVARDNTNLYFYVETNGNISPYTGGNWMQLFLRTNTAAANWEGYNYAVNLSVNSTTSTTLKQSTGGWNWSTVDNNIGYRVSGNKMELTIPRSDLGLGNTSQPISLDFKWADNASPNSDATEFYKHGDAAPNERFNYRFAETTASGAAGTYEAEAEGNVRRGVASLMDCTPCSGGSKVGNIGNGGYLQLNGIAASASGTYAATIAYVNADAGSRTASISANGGAATTVTFPSTGGSIGTVNVNATLMNGATNTVRFSNASGWAPDIDKLTLGSLVSSGTGQYLASNGFSSTQGASNWSYQYWDGSTYTNMTWDAANSRWSKPGTNSLVAASSQHPDYSADSVRKFTAPQAGNVTITGTVRKQATTGGDGVDVKVMKNGAQIWPASGWQHIAYNDAVGYTLNVSTSVAANDAIYFIVNHASGDTSYDAVEWDPLITYANPSHQASTEFGSVQGGNNWSYQYWNGSAYVDMTWDGANSRWSKAGTNSIIGSNWQHPDYNAQSARKYTVQQAGAMTVTGDVAKLATGGDGVNVRIMKNGTQIWPASGWQAIGPNDTVGYNVNVSTSVAVGDAIYFIVNENGTTASDTTGWDPIVSIASSNPQFNAAAGFSSTQGANQWSYEYWDGSAYTAMTWDAASGVWRKSGMNAIVGDSWQHPDNGVDSVRKFTAPQAGTVTITGNVAKLVTGGDGVNVRILKNGTQIWPASGWQFIGPNDTAGVSVNLTATVATGDVLRFIVNQYSLSSYDNTAWNPVIAY